MKQKVYELIFGLIDRANAWREAKTGWAAVLMPAEFLADIEGLEVTVSPVSAPPDDDLREWLEEQFRD